MFRGQGQQLTAGRPLVRPALVRHGPGVQAGSAPRLFTELGPDFVTKFLTAKCFASWLGHCPDNRITGGKIYRVQTRDMKSRVAEALRLAAQSLLRARNYFGDLYRRWRARLGGPKAITAMAHT